MRGWFALQETLERSSIKTRAAAATTTSVRLAEWIAARVRARLAQRIAC